MLPLIGLTSVLLLTSLQGCASTEYALQPFPSELAENCVKRPVALETNGQLAIAYKTRDQDLDICNADKAALRAWLKSIDAPPRGAN